MKTKNAESDPNQLAGKRVRIEHRFPPEQQHSAFSNHLVVQHSEAGEFQLLFFEITPPPLLGDASEVRAALDKIDSVDAVCVARVAVTKDRVPSIIAALAENLGKFEDKFEPAQTTCREDQIP